MIRASAKRKTPINRGFFRGSYIQKDSKSNIIYLPSILDGHKHSSDQIQKCIHL